MSTNPYLPLPVTIDTMDPAQPAMPDLLDSSDTGSSSTDNVTSKMQPAFEGITEPNAKVFLFANPTNDFLGQTFAAPVFGNWEITSEPLKDGVYDVAVQAMDLAGNLSLLSAPLQVTIDGTARCWGNDDDGQSDPPSGSFRAVSAGKAHTCGITTGGELQCWGSREYGIQSTPSGVFTQVDARGENACAVTSGGAVRCWGKNAPAPPLGSYDQVSVGPDQSCGVRTDRTLHCWGSLEATLVGAPGGEWAEVGVGEEFACARPAKDGLMRCWGTAMDGQTYAPFGLYDDLDVGVHHSCAIDRLGGIACWGRDNDGMASPPL